MISIKIDIDPRLATKLRALGAIITKPKVKATAALVALAIPMTLMAAPVTVPNEFSAGSPASASDVNANFAALATGINDNDTRLTTLLATNPAPSQAGVSAYITSTDANSTVGTSYNSAGGTATMTGTTGDYAAVFGGITCIESGSPVGVASVVPYISSTSATCRIAALTQDAAGCRVAVRCFDSAGSLRAGAVAIEYKR